MKFPQTVHTPQFKSIVFVILTSRLVSFLAFPTASLLPDSGSYAPAKFLDFSLVSFTGHAMRGWPTPLIFALLPNGSSRIFCLLLISGFSWIYLSRVLLAKVPSEWAKWAIALCIASIAGSPNIIQWDNTILGQSLMTSNMVLAVALLINFIDSPSNGRITITLIATSALLVIQKSSNFPIFIFISFIALVMGWKLRSLVTKILLIGLLVICGTYSYALGVTIDNNWPGGSYSGRALLWHLGGQSPAAIDFKNFLSRSTKAPACIYQNAPYSNIDVEMSRVFTTCPNAESYISSSIKRDFLKFIITNPKALIKLEAIGFGASFSNSASNYGRAVGILPSPIYSLTQGYVSPDFRFSKSQDQVQAFNSLSSGEPIWIYSPSILWLLLSFIFLIWTIRKKKKISEEFRFLLPISILILEMLITFVAVPSEWVRLTSSYVPLVTLLATWYLASGEIRNKRSANDISLL
jgi:hypothetical protein